MKIKLFIALILIVGVFIQTRLFVHFDYGQTDHQEEVKIEASKSDFMQANLSVKSDYFISDTIYRWNDQLLDWVETNASPDYHVQFVSNKIFHHALSEPIAVDWKVLMDIEYKLRYFSEMDMEMYAPIFPKSVEDLHEREVVIEGFVIPLDAEEEIISLSFNPYSSCFFCGKAGPASIISMYLKKKRNRYKIDDFIKFKGTLHLNKDDPNEFYYILKNAQEV